MCVCLSPPVAYLFMTLNFDELCGCRCVAVCAEFILEGGKLKISALEINSTGESLIWNMVEEEIILSLWCFSEKSLLQSNKIFSDCAGLVAIWM